MTISIASIGHNEEKNLARCFESTKWADEIVYVDCQSTDKSVEIAGKYTQKIFFRDNTSNLNVNKQFAIYNLKVYSCNEGWNFKKTLVYRGYN